MFRPVLGAVGLCLALLLLPSTSAFAGAVTGTVDWIGVYRPGQTRWYLRNANLGPDTIVKNQAFGRSTDTPVVGDWNGSGEQQIGVYRISENRWYFRDPNFGSPTVTNQAFGKSDGSDLPVVGNWLSAGPTAGDSIGSYRDSNGRFYFRDELTGAANITNQAFGMPGGGDLPVVGDWSGSGSDSIGVYRSAEGRFYLRSVRTGPAATTRTQVIGNQSKGDLPVVGDWDGDGDTNIGCFRPATASAPPQWRLTDTNLAADIGTKNWGQTNGSDVGVVGHWQDLVP